MQGKGQKSSLSIIGASCKNIYSTQLIMTKCLPPQQKGSSGPLTGSLTSWCFLGNRNTKLRQQAQRVGEDPKTATLDDIGRNGPFLQLGSWPLKNVSFHLKCKNCKGKVATDFPPPPGTRNKGAPCVGLQILSDLGSVEILTRVEKAKLCNRRVKVGIGFLRKSGKEINVKVLVRSVLVLWCTHVGKPKRACPLSIWTQ